MFPVIIANCVIQLVPVIDRYLASYLKEGSIATLDYAYKLILFPITTLVWAFSSIIFPIFSFTYQENIEKFKNTVITCIRIIIFLSMPTFITLFVLSLPICRLVYERGTFNPFDTMRVSSVLKFYSLGIIGWGVVEILNRAFFSLQNTKIPLIIGVVASFFNIVGSITLVKFMGINGLALASALSIILNMVISFLILKKLINFNFDYLFLKSLISIFLGSILTGILIYFLLPYFETPYFLATLEGRITSLTFLIILTFGIYITLLYLFKNQELKIIYKEVIFKWREKIKMKIG
jgi:putative peptidoglycan lipid II flippase